jgi:hypothetical protein
MAYRIHAQTDAGGLRLLFEGLLDPAALAELRAVVVRGPAPVRLHLAALVEIEPACLDGLRRLPAARTAASPVLMQLLADDP